VLQLTWIFGRCFGRKEGLLSFHMVTDTEAATMDDGRELSHDYKCKDQPL
jgi:hypothetical protein